MIKVYTCYNGCCTIKISSLKNFSKFYLKTAKKSGIFIYDKNRDSLLLVQSKGNLWGLPKGTLQDNENFKDCAIREVKEETGLTVLPEELSDPIVINNKVEYFYLERSTEDVNVQNHLKYEKNDATGISWIKIKCLERLILNGEIKLNSHCKIMCKKILRKVF